MIYFRKFNANLAQNMERFGINLRRNPYRGIIVEIAQEMQVSEGAVRYGLKNANPKVCEIFLKKVSERESVIQRFNALKKEVA